ncbi:MAG: hypothetical protein LBL83_04645 [Clostridiales bacterium]|jgi:hypothetical protein|nr:hypothetical protein [Clostridiales bacterium]
MDAVNVANAVDAIVASLLEQGAWTLLLTLAIHFFRAFIVYYFMYSVLPSRLNILALAAMALVYAAWCMLRLNGDPSLLGTRYHFWMNMFINAWTYFIITFLFQGKFWKKLITWWYIDVVKSLAEAVAYVPVMFCGASRGFRGEWSEVALSLESDITLKLLFALVNFALYALLGFLSLAVWRRLMLKKFEPFHLLFIALPMALKYTLSHVFRPSMGDWFFGIIYSFVPDVSAAYTILSLLGIALAFLAGVATLYYVLSYDKRAAIEAELRDAKRSMEIEQARRTEVERRGEELARLRHDFNNQLASIVQLARAGEDGTAQEIISALSNEINQ